MPSPSPALKPVSAPLTSTSLSRLMYILISLSILLISYYSYRGLSANMSGKVESGSSSTGCSGGKEESVEDRIDELATVLGMPSKELASAIAGAVQKDIHPSSL